MPTHPDIRQQRDEPHPRGKEVTMRSMFYSSLFAIALAVSGSQAYAQAAPSKIANRLRSEFKPYCLTRDARDRRPKPGRGVLREPGAARGFAAPSHKKTFGAFDCQPDPGRPTLSAS